MLETVTVVPDSVHTVVVNDEEQYAIWPATHDLPAGWQEAGRRGSRGECLAYVERVWTDMRPLSARRPAHGEDQQ